MKRKRKTGIYIYNIEDNNKHKVQNLNLKLFVKKISKVFFPNS